MLVGTDVTHNRKNSIISNVTSISIYHRHYHDHPVSNSITTSKPRTANHHSFPVLGPIYNDPCMSFPLFNSHLSVHHNDDMSEQIPDSYPLRQGRKRNYKEMNSGRKYRLPTKKKSNHHVGHYKLKRTRGGISPGPQGSSLSHDMAQSPPADLNPFIINSTIV